MTGKALDLRNLDRKLLLNLVKEIKLSGVQASDGSEIDLPLFTPKEVDTVETTNSKQIIQFMNKEIN